MSEAQGDTVVQGLSFRAQTCGPVKRLDGFDKSRHKVPDSVSPATSAFLAKLCGHQLGTEAEDLFQTVREALGYTRKHINLSVDSPLALLKTTDFVLELAYALNEADPSEWVLSRSLQPITAGEFLRLEPFNRVFAGMFSDLVFSFVGAVDVESVIDAIEESETPHGLRVDYPSDCRECELTVAEVAAKVRVDPSALHMVFPRPGSPAELLDEFLAVRSRFKMAKNPILGGLLG